MSLDGSSASYLPYTINGLQEIAADSSSVNSLQVNSLTPNRIVVSDGSNYLVSSAATSTEADYLSGTTSNIQSQLNNKASLTYVDTNFLNKTTTSAQTVEAATTFNRSLTGVGGFYTDVSGYHFGRPNVNYNSWSIKRVANGTQIRDLLFKDDTAAQETLKLSTDGQTVYTGLICDYTTASKIPIFDANKNLVSSGVDASKIDYLDNVSSDIQTQLNTLSSNKADITYVDTQDALRVPYTGATQGLDMGAFSIKTTYTPVAGADVINKTYGDATYAASGSLANYVLKAGDTMTGALIVNETVSTGDRILGSVDGSGNFWLGLRGSGTEIQRLAINLNGDATTGEVSYISMAKRLDMGANKITTTYVPVNGADLINKTYGDATYLTSASLANYVLKAGDTMTGGLTVSSTTTPLTLTVYGTNASTTESIYFTTTANHYSETAGQSYLFAGPSGYLLIGRNTTRDASTANLMIGAPSTNVSEIISTKSDGTGFLPLNFAGSSYYFSSGNVGVNQSSPQWKIHANLTNSWNTAGEKAQGIIGVGGADGDPDYQYIVFPNPAQGDGQISGLYWWSADMITGRYKNEFRLAWYKETHAGGLGNAYKEGITLFLSDSGGYNYLDSIKLNAMTQVNGDIQIIRSTRATIYPTYSADQDIQVRSNGTGVLQLNNDNSGNTTICVGGGRLGVRTNSPEGDLHVQVAGAVDDYWGKLKVKTTSFWGDGCSTRSETAGVQYATMFPMMFINPHIVSESDGWCDIRMGRANGVGTGTWWEIAVRPDGNFQIGAERSSQFVINPSGNIVVAGTILNNSGIIWNVRGDCSIYNGTADAFNPTSVANNLIIKSWWGIGYQSYDGAVRMGMDTRTGSMTMIGRLGVGANPPRFKAGIAGGDTSDLTTTGAWADNANGLLISTTVAQTSTTAGLALGFTGTGHITCLSPSITWINLFISAATTVMYSFGVYSAYCDSFGWVNVSDEREKEDIQDLNTSRSLEKVLSLRPKHYRRRFDDDATTVSDSIKERRGIGFLAQEVLTSNPHCVSTWDKKKCKKNGIETEEDAKEEAEKRFGICYNDYIVHLCGAVQEQQKMIDAQAKRIEVLEAREKIWEEDAKKKEQEFAEYKELTDRRMEQIVGLVKGLLEEKASQAAQPAAPPAIKRTKTISRQ